MKDKKVKSKALTPLVKKRRIDMQTNKKVKSKTPIPLIFIILIFLLVVINPTFIFAENQCNNPDYTTTLSSSNTNYTNTDSVFWIRRNYNYHTYYIDVQESGTVTINIDGGYAGFTYGDDFCPLYSNDYHTTKTFHTTSDFNLYVDAMQKQGSTNYTLAISFIPDNPKPASDTDDICYNDLMLSGFCAGVGFCSAGLNCKKTYPLQIKSLINNVKIFYNETGLSGSFGDGCGVDPSGTCQTVHDVDFGSFGFFSQATEFDINDVDQNTNNPDIWTKNLMEMSCFYDDKLYVIYEKDGVTHKGKLEKCSKIQGKNKFRDFTIRNPEDTRNIKGNVKFIGNTVLEYGYNNFRDLTNSQLDLQYIDIDSDTNTYNSSKAQLNMPTNSTIVWAGLYTQGYLNGTTSIDKIYQKLNEPLYFTAPSIETISVTPDVIDYSINEDQQNEYGYTYDTYTEIKQLEGKTASEVNGWITAANIKCYEGIDDSGLGNFGAWTLVVVYKNPDEKLKNISVFDGYKKVANETDYKTVNIPVSGFLTPLRGDINSALSMFVGEGDKYITGDKLYVNDTGINTTNAFDSSITGVIRDPSVSNNQGIDIQNHDISSIINNGDTEANIKLTSDGDTYFPSVVAFATDLYEPRVCYYIDKIIDESNQTVYENKNFTQDLVQNQKYKISIWIANMKKDPADTDIETAKNVKISVDYKDFDYIDESTFIKNTDSNSSKYITDATNDDIGEFLYDLSQSDWRVGDEATITSGGTLYPTIDFNNNTNKVFIDINGTFIIDNNATEINLDDIFTINASYVTNFLEITNPVPIPKCQDFNTIGSTYIPTLGAFNVINKNYAGGTVPSDANNSINALYTQIANNPFEVKVVSLSDNLETPKNINALIGVDLIKNPSTESECQTNPTLAENNVTFDNQSSKSLTLSYSKADKDLRFRTKYLVDQYGSIIDWKGKCSNSSNNTTYNDYACIWGVLTSEVYVNSICNEGNGYPEGQCPCAQECNPATNSSPNHNKECIQCVFNNPSLTKSVCSRDNFAIRPDGFNFTISGTSPYKAGKDYNISFEALDKNNNTVIDYNETIDSSFKININETKAGCITGTLNPDINSSWNFMDGNKTIQSNYSEIGTLNIKIKEINGNEFAKVDADDTPDTQRLIATYDKNLTFIPDHFSLSTALINHGQNFTYISRDLNMSATLDINITAQSKQNTTTQNYNSACYAQKTNYNISHGNLTITPTNALTRILYLETNTSIEGNNSINSDINLTNIPKSIFSTENNGTGSIHIKINFDRNTSKAVNPFRLNIADINVTDANNTKGNENLDKNTTFYYGRVHAPDYRFAGTNGTATIYYEVYCKDCNKTDYNIAGNESIDSINWYLNSLHNALSEGNVSKYSSVGDVKFENNVSDTTNSAYLSNISNGEETIDTTAPKTPYKDKIDMNSSPWLVYNLVNQNATTNDFLVEFFKANAGWAGLGYRGKTVDLNISTIQNRRLDW